MLRQIDRVFLQEFVSLPYMGKPVTAFALYQAGCHPEIVAQQLHQQVLLLDENKARDKARKEGDAPRVQIAVIAKLIGEFVSGLEDLGALCYAIKHRNEESIFKRYCLSETEHGQYHKFVVDSVDAGIELHDLLAIPKLDSLLIQFENDQRKREGFAQLYQQSTVQIIEAAMRYKNIGTQIEKITNPKDYAYVVCDAVDTTKARREEKRGAIVRIYNKIKHRFLVFEDRESLDKALGAQDIGLEIGWSLISRKADDVLELYKMTMGVSQCLFTVAGLLLILESNGADI